MGMILTHRTGAVRRARPAIPAFAVVALSLFATAPAFAQMPSMMGAPSLSPVAPPETSPAPMMAPQAPMAAPPAAAQPDPGASAATGCEADMMKHQQRRNVAIEQINQMVKGGKKRLDPSVACPKFRNLAAVEGEMKNWMIKNKDWCAIPDEVIENMKAGFARTPQIASQACAAAAQMKRMQQQGGQQARGPGGPSPAVKLPSGPL